MQSLFFEDVEVDMEFRSALSDPITLELLERHAHDTGDRVHKPVQVGNETKVVVQGNWITARTGGLLFSVGHFNDTLILQTEKVIKYSGRVFVGDRIRAVERVISKQDVPGKPYGIVTLSRQTYNEAGDLVQNVPHQVYSIRKK